MQCSPRWHRLFVLCSAASCRSRDKLWSAHLGHDTSNKCVAARHVIDEAYAVQEYSSDVKHAPRAPNNRVLRGGSGSSFISDAMDAHACSHLCPQFQIP